MLCHNRDFIGRYYNNVDITAAEGDVRWMHLFIIEYSCVDYLFAQGRPIVYYMTTDT